MKIVRMYLKMILNIKIVVRPQRLGRRVLLFSKTGLLLVTTGECFLPLTGFAYQRHDGSMSQELRQRAMPNSRRRCRGTFVYFFRRVQAISGSI